MKWSAWVVGLFLLLILVGCGSGQSGSSAEVVSGGSSRGTSNSTASAHDPAAEPTPEQVRAWRAVGRHACQGMAPLEAALHFKASVREAGALKRFVELVTEPSPAVQQSPGYPRLVAAFYATTLPESQRAAAAAGCAEELAAHG